MPRHKSTCGRLSVQGAVSPAAANSPSGSGGTASQALLRGQGCTARRGPHCRGPGTVLRRPAGSRESLVVAGCLGRTRARRGEQQEDAMGRPFKQYLDGPRIYSCHSCRSHVADHDDIVSKVPTLTARYHRPLLRSCLGFRILGDVVPLGAPSFQSPAMHICSKWDISGRNTRQHSSLHARSCVFMFERSTTRSAAGDARMVHHAAGVSGPARPGLPLQQCVSPSGIHFSRLSLLQPTLPLRRTTSSFAVCHTLLGTARWGPHLIPPAARD